MPVQMPVYLDYNATTPIDPRVLEAMMPYLTSEFGNAASRNHAFGWRAEAAVESAREQIARLLGASSKEIVFTSGATESNNLAIKGAAAMYREKGNHIITCTTEHKAVIDPCKRLAEQGYEVTWLTPDSYGRVSAQQVADAITDRTILISLMAANNEIGTLHPIVEIAKVAKDRGVIFHSDATQAVGKVPIDVEATGIDLLSLSAHKIYGPKGVGALYVRRRGPRVRLVCQMDGGGHERGMRSGTLNVPGIVGLGAAAEICRTEMDAEAPRLAALRDRLHKGIADRLDHVQLNGHPIERTPNTVNLSFAYVEGEALMMKMKDVAVSSGSACTSASLEPSYVLRAIGVGDDLAHSSIRFGVGRPTTEAEIDHAVERVVTAVQELRQLSPLYELAQEGVDLKQVKWAPH
ncbi:MAG: Cysteine desulfurase [Planctomycetes bacterium ADurb.Bin126]|nr:MAG: Cysteine desulfurase [Planctomycetes bacterium ADurb.Bin126]HOD81380.1 IscS subfamily cysteine desulfurase [Phycisphaerae bacterium]HQL76064.1 IscS subfamily cysteine desulfurase [Phycisphaerae bacterium]